MPALTAYSIATFIHFRAFFFAPFALWAVWLIVKQREWHNRPLRYMICAVLVFTLSFSSLWAFYLVFPALKTWEIGSPVNLAGTIKPWAFLVFVCGTAGCAGLLIRAGAWFDLVLLCWMSYMWSQLPYAHSWYILVEVAWMGSAVILSTKDRLPLVGYARAGYTIIIAISVCEFIPVFGFLYKLKIFL